MAIKLYDLAGAEEDRRFSPNCWRTRMALAHKHLEVETVPWRFVEKAAIAASGQGAVPVIVDAGKTVFDSWTIANYLEDRYPERPSLFGGAAGRALARFVNNWTHAVVYPGLFRMIVKDIWDHVADKDRDYFRQSREQRLGTTLEQTVADREAKVVVFRASLQPLRATLEAQPFLGGAAPTYADYSVFGGFQWARCISRFKILEDGDPVAVWRQRLLDAFDGLAGKSKGYAC